MINCKICIVYNYEEVKLKSRSHLKAWKRQRGLDLSAEAFCELFLTCAHLCVAGPSPGLSVQACSPVPGTPVLPRLGAVMALARSPWRGAGAAMGCCSRVQWVTATCVGLHCTSPRPPGPPAPGRCPLRCTVARLPDRAPLPGGRPSPGPGAAFWLGAGAAGMEAACGPGGNASAG